MRIDRMLGYRSLKHPASPDPAAPDYWGQCARYWEESRVWWDNWAANFGRSLVLVLAAFAVAVVLLVTLG